MATQKCSVRRKVLQEVLKLVDEMIQLNELVYRFDAIAAKTSLGATEAKVTGTAVLTGGFPGTETDGHTTIADLAVGILNGNITVTVDGTATTLAWDFLAE